MIQVFEYIDLIFENSNLQQESGVFGGNAGVLLQLAHNQQVLDTQRQRQT
jgi:hypothetical protein